MCHLSVIDGQVANKPPLQHLLLTRRFCAREMELGLYPFRPHCVCVGLSGAQPAL